jgi:adenylate cyclase
MSENHNISLAARIDQQISRLDHLEEQTLAYYKKTSATVPAHMLIDFGQLAGEMAALKAHAERLERSNANLHALSQVGEVISSSLDPHEVLRIVMDTIIRLTSAERGFLMLRNRKGEIVIHVARNWEQESLHSSDFSISKTIVARVIETEQPILTTNAQEDPRFGSQASVVAHSLRSILCVPIKSKGRLTGIIYVDNRIRSGIFTEDERDLLAAFADQAAIAIENARLFENLNRTLAEVNELKNLMDKVFDSIASGVVALNTKGEITLCNKAAEAILERDSEQLIGRKLEDTLPGLNKILESYISQVYQLKQNLIGIELETRLTPYRTKTLSFNLSPLMEAGNRVNGVTIVVDDLTEKRHLQAQGRLFERMVSPAVIAQIDPDQLKLGGTRARVTTLFVDIRGFTGFSEKISPESLVSILNRYLAAAAESILKYQGTIDKFLGDAVMAWFNAPIPQEDHILRAVLAALSIRQATHKLWEELPEEYHLSFGAGIHQGDAVLGLVGVEKRLEFTAIGDSVNTAKRIQENALADQILISNEAYAQISRQVNARPAGAIQLKGKSNPILVYEVIGLR